MLVKQSGCLSLCLPVCLLYILFTYCVFALVKSYSVFEFLALPSGRHYFVVVFNVQPFLRIGEVTPLCFCSCEIGSWFPKIAHHKCGGGQETLKGPKNINKKISPVLSLTSNSKTEHHEWKGLKVECFFLSWVFCLNFKDVFFLFHSDFLCSLFSICPNRWRPW